LENQPQNTPNTQKTRARQVFEKNMDSKSMTAFSVMMTIPAKRRNGQGDDGKHDVSVHV
jgi:hypothetical protein